MGNKELEKQLEDAIGHYNYVIDELEKIVCESRRYEEEFGYDPQLTNQETTLKVIKDIRDAYSEQLRDIS